MAPAETWREIKFVEVELYITCMFSRMAPAETWIFFFIKKKKKKATSIFELVIKLNRSSTQKTSTSTGVDDEWLQGDIT